VVLGWRTFYPSSQLETDRLLETRAVDDEENLLNFVRRCIEPPMRYNLNIYYDIDICIFYFFNEKRGISEQKASMTLKDPKTLCAQSLS
jgi:hypothetical protein